jgi:hypothetical protein
VYSKKQIKGLLNRFDRDINLVISYLKDLCSKEKVLDLAKKYSSNPVQIQRDRNNFITKKISNGLIKELKKFL